MDDQASPAYPAKAKAKAKAKQQERIADLGKKRFRNEASKTLLQAMTAPHPVPRSVVPWCVFGNGKLYQTEEGDRVVWYLYDCSDEGEEVQVGTLDLRWRAEVGWTKTPPVPPKRARRTRLWEVVTKPNTETGVMEMEEIRT